MVKITLQFGSRLWRDMPLDRAAEILTWHVNAERDAWQYHMDLNEEHWIASFWSEALGDVEPPTSSQWQRPLTSIRSSLIAARSRNGDDRARSFFMQAVREYNSVHRHWKNYRNGVQEGGSRAVTIMEVSIVVLSTAATVGAVPAGAGLSHAVAAGTAMTAIEQSASALGNYFINDEEVDYTKFFTNIGMSTILGFVTGKVGEKVLGAIAPRLSQTWKIDPKLAKELFGKGGAGSNMQRFLTDFLVSSGTNLVKDAVVAAAKVGRDRKLSRSQFIMAVADELEKNLRSNLGKQAITSFLGSQGGRLNQKR
ncbi:MAG: hypothetical protein KDA89_23895 [Planctomycetaceae bacterium]|nr:hypothetical protein [Planctomycetaceae bacterium]